MFTGLVQAVGKVESAEERPFGLRLTLSTRDLPQSLELGESISISGVCLTLAHHSRNADRSTLSFDVVRETLAKTTLSRLTQGSHVNLERACRADTLLGGHIVQGHVDGLARVTEVHDDPHDWRLILQPPPHVMEFLAPKGSVCIDGVSLTVADLSPEHSRLTIALIPTTLDKTTLATLREGDEVNIEADCIAKQVVWWLKNYAPQPRA
ncbi:MAG: riboflavin synthase [Phycisphaerales bacterium]